HEVFHSSARYPGISSDESSDRKSAASGGTDSRTVPVYASDRSADAGLDIEAYGQHAADEGPLDQISRPCGPNNRWNSHRSSVFRLFVPQEAIRNVEYLPIVQERDSCVGGQHGGPHYALF